MISRLSASEVVWCASALLFVYHFRSAMPPKNKNANVQKDSAEAVSMDIDKLSPDGKILINMMKSEFQKFREEFSGLLAAKNTEIERLQAKVLSLEDELKKVKDNIDGAEAYERRDTIVLSGSSIPAGSQGENCVATVQSLIKDKFRVEVSDHDISCSPRLGPKPNNQEPDKRSLIVKFCRRDVKTNVLISGRRAKAHGLFVNESLTPARNSIYRTLRTIKRSHPQLVKGCSTFDGNVFAYTKAPNPNSTRDVRHKINTHERLTKFCEEHVKQPLSAFLDQ